MTRSGSGQPQGPFDAMHFEFADRDHLKGN
jgi:hypothetical protein